jgi:hypothetical protein
VPAPPMVDVNQHADGQQRNAVRQGKSIGDHG